MRRRRDQICHVVSHDPLPYCRPQRRMQQHMMLANGVVGKALFPQLPVILLHTHGRQLLRMHLAKRWNHVGVQDILITVARCFRAVRRDDLTHPVAQPVLHRNIAGSAFAAEQLRAAIVCNDLLRLLHRLIGARAAHAPAVFAVVVERDIIKVISVVIRQISFERFSHIFPLFPPLWSFAVA